MKPLKKSNLASQTATHLLDGIRKGTWRGKLPGVLKLAVELGVSKDTVREALVQLEKSGHLLASRPGQRRTIKAARESSRRVLRVGVLLPEPLTKDNSYSQRQSLMVRESIELQGHVCFFSDISLREIDGKLGRLKKMVSLARADAWILYASTRSVLEWFAKSKIPAFCIGGHMTEIPLPHSRSGQASGIQQATSDFIRQGHRRIVLIASQALRKPQPSPGCSAFIDVLKANKLSVSDFNLPDWDTSPDGLYSLLERLFRFTPPTGILTIEPGHTFAVLSFLAQRGLRVPEDVSLFCAIPDPLFRWHRPAIGTLNYRSEPHVQRMVQWLQSLESGSIFQGSQTIPLGYLPGGCVGPAKGLKDQENDRPRR
jgi:DNA-binding LacI/PurR family transcriptional regulator